MAGTPSGTSTGATARASSRTSSTGTCRRSPLMATRTGARPTSTSGRLYREVLFALPRELSERDQIALASRFAGQLTDAERLPSTLAVHRGDGRNPHAHLVISKRANDGIARDAAQWFKRHNAQAPAQGGARKTRALVPRDWLTDTREAWATEVNRTLERYGERERVDHRSLAVRATEAYTRGDFDKAAELSREPGVHLGPAALRAAGGAELAVVGRARQVHDETRDADRRWEHHTIETSRIERAIGELTHGLHRLQDRIAEVRDRVREWIQHGRPEPEPEPERGPTLDPDFGPSR